MTTALALTRDAILQHAQSLPAAPQVLGGLCELLEDVNTDLDQIAGEIRIDPVLAARVIRISNSVTFGGGSRVGSVEEAVNRVGYAEVVRLVGIATVAGLVDRALPMYGLTAARLRESLLLHALGAETLASSTTIEPRAAYAVGLLRGVGMMVLDRAARGRIAAADAFDATRFATCGEWEQSRFGMTAVEVATTVLELWRFPTDITTALEQHLTPGDNPFANVLNLAGAIVAAHGLALPGEASCWAMAEEKLSVIGLDAEQWQAASAHAAAVFARQRAMLS